MLRFKIFLLSCTLSGLKEENTGVGMRWYLSNSPITARGGIAHTAAGSHSLGIQEK